MKHFIRILRNILIGISEAFEDYFVISDTEKSFKYKSNSFKMKKFK